MIKIKRVVRRSGGDIAVRTQQDKLPGTPQPQGTAPLQDRGQPVKQERDDPPRGPYPTAEQRKSGPCDSVPSHWPPDCQSNSFQARPLIIS